jgi:hypothetical protein
MKKFRVILRRDAWINYSTVIESDTAEKAAAIAERAWKDGDESVKFEEDGLSEFDEVLCDPDDCEEIEN